MKLPLHNMKVGLRNWALAASSKKLSPTQSEELFNNTVKMSVEMLRRQFQCLICEEVGRHTVTLKLFVYL